MKNHDKKSGFTLIELVVAIPMLAFVFLGMGYLIGTTGTFAATEIAKIKTQVAANNILMVLKSTGYLKLGETLNFCKTKENSKAIKVTSVEIPKDSFVHPDNVTNLKLSMEEKAAGDDAGNVTNNICIVTVVAEEFNDIQTTVKIVSF